MEGSQRKKQERHIPEWTRMLRFALVGAAGTLVDFSILSLLQAFTALPLWLDNVFSYGAGILCNYTLNRRWTFRSSGSAGRLVQYALVSAAGLGLNTLLLIILEPLFSWMVPGGWQFLPAKAAATLIVFFWNYGMNRVWTFRAASSKQFAE